MLSNSAIVALGAADPLNLTGIVTLGDRIPATASTRIAFRDGVPVATLTGVRKFDSLESQTLGAGMGRAQHAAAPAPAHPLRTARARERGLPGRVTGQ